MSAKILLIEDEAGLVITISDLLTAKGFTVESASDGPAGLAKVLSGRFDLVILDVMLPGMSGLDVCRRLREHGNDVPVLMLTAKTQLADRVAGLRLGADDYLIKPFDLPELQARVRALLRRHGTLEGAELRIGPLTMRMGEPRVTLGDTTVDMPAGEFALLEALALRVGHVVSRARIAAKLTRGSDPPSDTAIEICVHRLRRRLEPHGLKVRTLRGFGYVLESAPESS